MRSPTSPMRRATYALAALAVSASLAACEPGLDPQSAGPSPTGSPTSAPSAAPSQAQDDSTASGAPATATAAAPSAPPPAPTGPTGGTGGTGGTGATHTGGGAPPPPPAEPTSDPTAPAVPAGLESFYGQQVSWEACADGAAGAQCATVSVPLDYDDPTGTTISIALRRHSASDGQPENGALFLNPGGPGESGTAFVAAAASQYTPEMLAAYDLIGFDPRGTGDSTHLTCWAPDEAAGSGSTGSAATGTEEAPLAEQEEAAAAEDELSQAAALVEAQVAAGSAQAAACRQYSEVPELIDHMSTAEAARDLDILRAVVGEPELDYLGYSYGTELGAAYIALFPDNVGRTVLDSAVDPSLSRDESREAQMATREGRVRQYLEFCLTQEGCPLTGTVEEATSQLIDFVNSVAEQPLTVTLDDQTSQMDIQTVYTVITNLALAREEYWPSLTMALTAAMTQRDASELARLAAQAPSTGQLDPSPDTEAALVSNVAYSVVTCSDDPVQGDAAAWAEDLIADNEAYPFTAMTIGSSSFLEPFCQGLGVAASPVPGDLSRAKTEPVLVVGVTGDPQTPYAWSQSLASQLRNGHLLTVTNYQHGATALNSCATAAVSEFLVTGTLPADDQTCPIDPLPQAAAEALAQ
ncbi:MAG: alpha/beta hydrolase [Actinomyces sp.]|uniref:alpha/beta hydrolase n=1 Tax=Actinomyces sp. TaxID=29317 RepID=UPI0026DB090A|nr:alpha/beta hydrolase [Actinomyces sp.]MDO4243119.1 alpha/beta hydrolase [Actinomyces sp.]